MNLGGVTSQIALCESLSGILLVIFVKDNLETNRRRQQQQRPRRRFTIYSIQMFQSRLYLYVFLIFLGELIQQEFILQSLSLLVSFRIVSSSRLSSYPLFGFGCIFVFLFCFVLFLFCFVLFLSFVCLFVCLFF